MVLDLVIIGLAITLEPFPITADILLLSAERGTIKGLGFLLGWMACLVVVVAAVVLGTGGKPLLSGSSPSTGVLTIKLALGVGLVLLAYRQHKRSGRPHKQPKWMSRLDHISPWTAAGLAAFLQPWTLVAAGAATITEANLRHPATYGALVLFCLLGCSSLLALELYSAFAPARAGARLERLRTGIDTHRDQAIVVLSLLVGLWLMGKSLYQLS